MVETARELDESHLSLRRSCLLLPVALQIFASAMHLASRLALCCGLPLPNPLCTALEWAPVGLTLLFCCGPLAPFAHKSTVLARWWARATR